MKNEVLVRRFLEMRAVHILEKINYNNLRCLLKNPQVIFPISRKK
jgi:hypothetical protein